MENRKRVRWIATALSFCCTLAYTPTLAPGDLPPELHLENIKLKPITSIISSVPSKEIHNNFYSDNTTIGGTNNHYENNIVEKGTNNIFIGNTHFAGNNNNVTNNVHKQGSNNIYIGNTTVSSSNNDIHDTYSEGSDNNVVINSDDDVKAITGDEYNPKVSPYSNIYTPRTEKAKKQPYPYKDDTNNAVCIFILIAVALFLIVHFRLQGLVVYILSVPFRIVHWLIYDLYDFFNEVSGPVREDTLWYADMITDQNTKPDVQPKHHPSHPVHRHLNHSSHIHPAHSNASITVPAPVKPPLPLSDEKFCSVRFPGRSKKTYDYFIGDLEDIEVGDIVEVFVHDRWTETIVKKLATVTYLSRDGEVSPYARSTVIKIHHKFHKLLQ